MVDVMLTECLPHADAHFLLDLVGLDAELARAARAHDGAQPRAELGQPALDGFTIDRQPGHGRQHSVAAAPADRRTLRPRRSHNSNAG